LRIGSPHAPNAKPIGWELTRWCALLCEVVILQLPPSVWPQNLPRFVDDLGAGNGADAVRLDFRNVAFLTPGAIAALVAKSHSWLNQGKPVEFTNHQRCSAFQYLQRVNVFRLCGISISEAFKRRDPTGRFLPLQRIGKSSDSRIEEISTAAASCIVPDLTESADPNESGPFDCVEYSISEMVSNVLHHSGEYGFITAQYLPQSDFARLAIADCGRGILASFRDRESPHWYDGMDDIEAIKTALKPKVSSRTHLGVGWGSSVNAGVGLTLLREWASLVGGEFLLLSGTGVATLQSQKAFANASRSYDGTICEIGFPRTKVRNFFQLLQTAKENAGLISKDQHGARFT
jgi:hypothetical protein